MKLLINITLIMCCFILVGCETVKEGGRTVGRGVGEVTNTVGTISEGGAEAVQGQITDEENPYGR